MRRSTTHLAANLAGALLLVAALMLVSSAQAASKRNQNPAQQNLGQMGQAHSQQSQSQQGQSQAGGQHAGMLNVTIVRREGHRAGTVLVRVHHLGAHGGGRLVANRHLEAGTLSIDGPSGRYRIVALHRGHRQVRHARVVSGRQSHVVITIAEHVHRHHRLHGRFLLGLHHRHHHLDHGPHKSQQPQTPQQSKSTATFTPGISAAKSSAGKP